MSIEPNTAESLSFLRRWPAGTLQLTAIHIDPHTQEKGLIESRAFDKDSDLDDNGPVQQWINERQGKANLYYALNTLLTDKNGRASKKDVKEVVAFHVDVDVPAGEDQKTAADSLCERIKGFDLEPSVIVASGGGVQAFWILQPSDRIPINGEEARWQSAERYTQALETAVAKFLGTKADATFNVDRIMRLPGTINVPDIKKLKKGRGPALARKIKFSDVRYPIGAFNPAPADSPQDNRTLVDWSRVGEHAGWLKSSLDLPQEAPRKWKLIVDHPGSFKELNEDLKHDGLITKGYAGRSELAMGLAGYLKACGYPLEKVAAGLMCPLPCNGHITEKRGQDQRRAIERAIERSHDKQPGAKANGSWPGGVDEDSGRPLPNYSNTKAAVGKLNVECWHDEFRQQDFIKGLDLEWLAGPLNDRAVSRLRDRIDERFSFYPQKEQMLEALTNLCTENKRNPVVEWLDSLQHDGKARIERLFIDYLGAPDTPLNRAYGRKFMCAVVRRAKQPGCKWDHQPVLGGGQGIRKSMFCEDLAVAPDLFTDAGEFGSSIKEAMEVMTGKQIIEVPEMAGHGRADREKNKAFLTRKVDRARMAYARFATDAPRSSVTIGTVNEDGYLNDPTGERRYWPVEATDYSREAFLKDKEQLYAEAVACEPDEKLWLHTDELRAAHDAITAAVKEPNELVEGLSDLSGTQCGDQERVTGRAVRKHLGLTNVDVARMHSVGRKIADAMRTLGWRKERFRADRHGTPERGYVRPLAKSGEQTALPLGHEGGGSDAIPF